LRGPNLSLSCGVEAGIGAGTGFGVATGSVGEVVFDLTGAEVGRGGSGANALVGEEVGERVGVGLGVGTGVFGAGVFGWGTDRAALTVVEDPAGIERSKSFAVVSTVPEIVTMVVSPLGETETYESEPARITDAMPAL